MSKDVDCLNPKSVGEVFLGRSRWAPCTPRACMATLSHYGIELKGKNVVVVGRSNVVGKPLVLLLLHGACYGHCLPFPDQGYCGCAARC